jgi:hypothetical protein
MSATISMYTASVPQFDKLLANLDGILAKAETWAEAKKIDHGVVLGLRLVADMLPFIKQVHIATDFIKGCAGRLAGVDFPKFEDNETNLVQLRDRVARTRAFLATLKAEQFTGSEARAINLKFGPTYELNFNGHDYLVGFALPNVYFHLATAYGLLRSNGLELGKKDFVG